VIERIPIPDRSAWLALRRRDITASDIGALFGCHPYRSPLQVFADKVGEGHDRGDNSAMRRGRILEPAVAAAVAEEKPDWRIEKVTEYLRDPDLRLGATPDWYVHNKHGLGVLETKTADPSVFERDWKSGPPLAWTLQCLVQMVLTGASWGAVAVLVTSRDFPVFIYDVPRHEGAEAKIAEKVRAFWTAIEAGQQPPADFGKDGPTIEAMFKREQRGSEIDLSGNNRLPLILDRRAELVAELKDADARKDAIDAEIKQAIGLAETASVPGWRITWRTQHRKEQVLAAKDIRVLRITDLRSKGEAA
jgi:putative phage-type endonuclease